VIFQRGDAEERREKEWGQWFEIALARRNRRVRLRRVRDLTIVFFAGVLLAAVLLTSLGGRL
jgi:hypothetical protein